MEGRDTFTTSQINAIKKLIAEKVLATSNKQKGIRRQIRNIGFYYSDFSSKKDGYTVADFEELILKGQIKVTEDNDKPLKCSFLTPSKPDSRSEQLIKPFSIGKNLIDLNDNLAIFKQNRFDPKTDNEKTITNSPGNYIICLKKYSQFPAVSIRPIFTDFEELQVIYTGLSGVSLKTRDYRQHFKGNNASGSTLRKSLGVLFNYKQVPRSESSNLRKKKFSNIDEQKLTEWMCENLIMFFLPTSEFERIEVELINHFNPPFNLKGSNSIVNFDFRQLLLKLRAKKS